MNLRFSFLVLCSGAAFASLLGCQNNLTVRVDQVLGVSTTRLNPESRLGQQLDAAIRDLGQLVRKCDDADRAMTDFVATFPPDQQDIPESAIQEYREFMRGTSADAASHRDECRAYFRAEDIGVWAPDVRAALRQVEAFFESAAFSLEKWHKTASRMKALQDLLADSRLSEMDRLDRTTAWDRVGKQVAGALAATDPTGRPNAGFGGFVSTDVYTINPSDPAYQKVLGPAGRLSTRPLTQVTVGASGDSAVLLVMEHPGQLRVHQVSNDPSQLTRNIGLIVNKATQAALRYSTAGAVPP